MWDGNVPLHEWSYKAVGLQSDEEENILPKEPAEDVTTWVFEAGTFVPTAKIQDGKQYSIVSDYLGTPIQMYDEKGNKTWDCTLDIYGKVITVNKGMEFDCPFRFQGQYVDEESGLYYNRFRYYEPRIGSYMSQDPIGLKSGILAIYRYVNSTNIALDILGLSHAYKLKKAMENAYRPVAAGQTPHHIVQLNRNNEYVNRSKAVLERCHIGINDAENGVALWGTANSQVTQSGHPGRETARTTGTYHAGYIHSLESDKRICELLESAEKYAIDNKLSDNLKDNYVRKQLQKIGIEIESGRWNNSTH